MAGRLMRPMRDALLQLLVALSENDGEEAAGAAMALGERRDDVEFEEEAFVRRVTELVADQHAVSMDRLSPGVSTPTLFPPTPCGRAPPASCAAGGGFGLLATILWTDRRQ